MTTEIVNIDPTDILANDNIRFGLKDHRVTPLAEDIKARGVMNPISVERLDPAVDGCNYRVITGHYRTAAVRSLNEAGGSFLLPAIVRSVASDADRILSQIAENNQRENLSPMDKATAMKKMRDAGISEVEIRKAFATPGGKKGLELKPCSNAHVHMTIKMLEFPKPIQRKIHDGLITVGAAYDLTRYPSEKWEKILSQVEAARVSDLTRDEKEEKKFLESTKKLQEAEQAAEKTKTELQTAQDAKALAEKALAEKVDAAALALRETTKAGLDKAAKTAAKDAYKKATTEAGEAQKAAEQAASAVSKLSGKVNDAVEAAKKKLAEAQEKAKAKADTKAAAVVTPETKAVGQREVKQAAAAVGAVAKGAKPTPMNVTEIRACVDRLATPGSRPNVQAIGVILKSCLAGEFPPAQLAKKLGEVTGEK